MLSITIGIPTYNRCEALRLTLQSLLDVRGINDGACDVVVIDNNSTDATPKVVDEFAGRLPGLRRVVEMQQGLCFARNRAVREASGEVLALLDDDVKVDAGWLEALRRAYEETGADAAGGKSYLIFPGARPAWIGREEETLLSKCDHGAKRIETPDLYGLNFSFRVKWAGKVGLFRTDLDRIGGQLLVGGETEFLKRMVAAGARCVYDPEVVVGHYVHPGRLTWEWFVSRHYWGTRSLIRQRRVSRGEACVQCLRIGMHLPRIGVGLLWQRLRAGRRSASTFERRLWWANTLGEFMEYGRRVFGKDPHPSPLAEPEASAPGLREREKAGAAASASAECSEMKASAASE